MSTAPTLLSGAAFGAALVAAGVYQPSIIISQFKLENWHMIEAFLTATATSSVFYSILHRLNYVTIKPRTPQGLSLFSRFDANILGGAILGTGMALSGACPGTALAQVVAGVPSGYYALLGASLGGIAWTGFIGPAVDARKQKAAAQTNPETAKKLAVYDALGTSETTALIGFLGLNAAIVAATVMLTPKSSAPIPPVVGGLLIGLAQLFSLLTLLTMFGVSTRYEQVGRSFWWFVTGGDAAKKPTSYSNATFAAGVLAGAAALVRAMPELAEGAAADVSPAVALGGGTLIVLGARLAGGCPSGHGISGVSLLSISSIITIGTAFLFGGIVAPMMH